MVYISQKVVSNTLGCGLWVDGWVGGGNMKRGLNCELNIPPVAFFCTDSRNEYRPYGNQQHMAYTVPY